jgi:hypothetical protein
MGRTVPAFRPALEFEIKTWDDFRRGLRLEDREIFDKIISLSRIHADAGSLAARPDIMQFILVSICLEQQKQIDSLKKAVNDLTQHVQTSADQLKITTNNGQAQNKP